MLMVIFVLSTIYKTHRNSNFITGYFVNQRFRNCSHCMFGGGIYIQSYIFRNFMPDIATTALKYIYVIEFVGLKTTIKLPVNIYYVSFVIIFLHNSHCMPRAMQKTDYIDIDNIFHVFRFQI